ncbi:EAL domain-containing protein [Oxalobacteraceae bacterium A2-2]
MNAHLLPAAPRIVVIDPDPAARERAYAACRALGWQINGWAGCGAAALELIEALPSPPDLVLAELRLPDMDGADLVPALSMLERDFALALCASADARILDAALALARTLGLRACTTVAKPVSPGALAAALPCIAPPRESGTGAVQAAPALTASAPEAAEQLQALEQRQFELHYQPKISLRDGSLRGAEALLRWRHPRHGLLAPTAFLPETEEAGLSGMLTLEVLRIALDQWRCWREAGWELPLSLNLSALSLSDPHLAVQLIAATEQAGAPPSAITFEITEQSDIADLAAALRFVLKLRLRGFGLSLDDYGAGFASLLQLSRMPFTELKLDRSLVHGAAARPHLRPLLRHAILAAHKLGVETVAEGVEQPGDLALLRSLGCRLAQGYLVSRPMPASQLPAWGAALAGRQRGQAAQRIC